MRDSRSLLYTIIQIQRYKNMSHNFLYNCIYNYYIHVYDAEILLLYLFEHPSEYFTDLSEKDIQEIEKELLQTI